MPKYSLDPKTNKVVENPNFKESPIKDHRYSAKDAIAWKEIEVKPGRYNESMPWTQAEYENWEGDIKGLYAKYGVDFGKPLADKAMFDQQPDEASIREAYERGQQYRAEEPWPIGESQLPIREAYDRLSAARRDNAAKAEVQKQDLKAIEISDRTHGHWPAPLPANIKFREKYYLEEMQDYIAKTYGEHYAQGDIQIFESITASGHADGFAMGNILKLAARYGRKEGYNRKDLFKIIHYALLELWVHDNADR